jgi:hypothetical protein
MKNLVFACLVMLTTAARADTPTAESLFDEGQIAYGHGDFATAIAKWQVAYELSRENGLLFNIAQAQRRAGSCEDALATYLLYVASDPDPTSEQHRLAEDLARELKARCGTKPPKPPVSTIPTPDPLQPKLVAPLHETEDPGRAIRITGLVTGGAGLAALAAGLVLGHHARSIGDEVTRTCLTGCDWTRWQGQDAAGRRAATIGHVLDSVGIVGVVGGAATYYLGIRKGSLVVSPRPESGAVVSWSTQLP